MYNEILERKGSLEDYVNIFEIFSIYKESKKELPDFFSISIVHSSIVVIFLEELCKFS